MNKQGRPVCFLKDNKVKCGTKATATSTVFTTRRPNLRPEGSCAGTTIHSWTWPPSSDGSLPLLVALGGVIIVGGVFFFIRAEQTHGSSFNFPADDSWLARCHTPVLSIILLAFRLLSLVWCLYVLRSLYLDLVIRPYVVHLFWYTLWNYVLLTAYFCLSSVLSISGMLRSWCCSPAAATMSMGEQAFAPAGLLHKLQLVIFEVELPVSALVVAMVWFYLYPVLHDSNPFPTAFDDLSVHGINAAVMLVEYALNRLTLRPSHVVWVILWPTFYLAYQLLWLWPTERKWAYPFMSTTTILVVPWMIFLLLVHVLFFAGCLGLGQLCNKHDHRRSQTEGMSALKESLSVQNQ
eukprot:SAG31_NODE_3691_length_3985_cov_3.675244_5_plen_350_part_00